MHHRRTEGRHRAASAVVPAAPRPAPVGAAPLVRPAPGRALSPAQVLQMQRSVGNAAVARMLGGAVQRQESDEEMVSDEGVVSGEASSSMELSGEASGASSEAAAGAAPAKAVQTEEEAPEGKFKRVEQLAGMLLKDKEGLKKAPGNKLVIKDLAAGVRREAVRMKKLEAAHAKASKAYGRMRALEGRRMKKLREDAARAAAKQQKQWAKKKTLAKYPKPPAPPPLPAHTQSYLDAERAEKQANAAYTHQAARAVAAAKEAIDALWVIGKDYLPTHLMPAGAVFRDRAFHGSLERYTYHTGKDPGDAIPITWYKRAEDYPALRVPVPDPASAKHGKKAKTKMVTVSFPDSFTVGGTTFGVAAENRPRDGWELRKVAHNSQRDSQQKFNQMLNEAGVEVNVGGTSVKNALRKGLFDGDHVKDLGFGGKDRADNYWPLPSAINQRAYHGYNADYVLNYIDEKGKHRARAIGGLIGRWFRVRGFLGPDAGAVPHEADEGKAAGGERIDGAALESSGEAEPSAESESMVAESSGSASSEDVEAIVD